MLSEREQKIRSTGIGASEIGAIVGLNPYKRPVDIWARKIGLVSDEAGDAADWGNRLERVIAEKYSDTVGLPIRKATTRRHKGERFVVATPDFYVGDGPGRHLLEVKAPGFQQIDRWGREGTDEVPPEYAAQVIWQMYATGIHRCDLAAFFGNRDFRIYHMTYDPDFAASLVEAGREFMGYVERKEEPPDDGTDPEARLEYLKSRYRKGSEEAAVIEATPEIVALVHELRAAREINAEAKKAVAAAQARLCEIIGEAPGLRFGPDKSDVLWWKNNRASIKTDWKAVVTALRIQEPEKVAEIEAKYSEEKPGARVFRTPRSWSNTADDAE